MPLAAVLINDVKAEPESGALAIAIATSDPVATSAVRVVSGGSHRIYVYVDDSASRRPSFGEPPTAIIAHPRLRYTKLEVPTAERCGEPFGLVATDSGLRVRATCKQSAATPAIPPTAPSLEHPVGQAGLAPDTRRGGDWLARQASLAREQQTGASLRAALALPAEAPADEGVGESASGEAQPGSPPTPGPATGGKPGQLRAQATAAPAESVKTGVSGPPALPVAREKQGAWPERGTEHKSAGGTAAAVAVVALLVGVAILTVWTTRRRGGRERMIRILESASIGPRRSLVVARVGGRTMVLGVSEAGVALLDAPAHGLADASEPGHPGRLDLEVPRPSNPASADELAAESSRAKPSPKPRS